MLAGFDLSDYQTVGLGTSGAFAIVKASEGTGFRATLHDAHVAGLRAAGKLVGHYHFAHVANGGGPEAAWFLACAKPAPGDVVALDWEPYAQTNFSAAQIGPYIRDFATAVRAATGAWPWLYANDDQLYKIQAAVTASDWAWITSSLPLWKAGVGNIYVSDPSKGPGSTSGFRTVAAFQWAEKPLDQDVFYGDATTWAALAIPTTATLIGPLMALSDAEQAEILATVRTLWNVAVTGRLDGDRKAWPYAYTPSAATLSQVQDVQSRAVALAAKVDALTAQVTALPTPAPASAPAPTVDAAAVVTEMGKRLAQ